MSSRFRSFTPATKIADTNTMKTTIERIRLLESERRDLMLEIDELKRKADSKAAALEKEVAMLREEVKSLRVLLSGEEFKTEAGTPGKK